jgi:hypothetical protein
VPPPQNQTDPTCAVPRNDIHYQVPQPTGDQVNWAIQQAVRGNLTASRPANYLSLGLNAYAPDGDFPVPSLSTSSTTTAGTLPPQILNGILAQESNWDQASFHAPRTTAGNPLIADYYGIIANNGVIDFNKADCGYGIAQVTDVMTKASTAVGQDEKVKVAEDYAENLAAAVQILSDKWNQLFGLHITAGAGDPNVLQDWYFAIWAYNSGIHGDDGSGHSGLGWTNNPINPMYPPNRHTFLTDYFNDSKHPEQWPYQEKVYGWIEHPLVDGGTSNQLYSAASPGNGTFLQATFAVFCTASNSCDTSNPSANPCQLSDFHCWWHDHVSVPCDTADNCTPESFSISPGAPEPGAANRFPPVCQPQPWMGPGTQVVLSDPDPPGNLNLAGCPAITSDGTFSVDFGGSTAAYPPAAIDWHQLGGGFGGHFWFTHTNAASDTANTITGTWTPGTISGAYNVLAFVPSFGGSSRQAAYRVHASAQPAASYRDPGDMTRLVDQFHVSNDWVSLGFFNFAPGDSVSLSSATADGTILDVAFSAMAFVPMSSFAGLATIGDSYTSGEGGADPNGNAPTWDTGTDSYDAHTGTVPITADEWDMCHRADDAYARLYAARSNTFSGGAPIIHLACSGATSQNMFLNSSGHSAPRFGEGLQMDNLPPPQYVSRIVTTAGGNDVGLPGLGRACVLANLKQTNCSSGYPVDGGGLDSVDHQILNLRPQLEQLYTAESQATSGDVIVLTYPIVLPSFLANDQVGSCQASPVAPVDVNWLINKQRELDDVVGQAEAAVQATHPNVHLLDERNALAGHEVCTSDPWFNNVDLLVQLYTKPLPGNDYSKTKWVLHPNQAGQQKLASDLLAAYGG